jgi:4-amino-4-deoxy-L-arabinose transferase-like glycosyltransferase
LWFAGVAFVSMLFTHSFDRALLLGLPALATLAAFALPTLERRLSALIDWFTLFFFSSICLLIWGVWIAMQTGIDPKSVLLVRRLVPGFIPSFSLFPFLIALLGTLAWGWLVSWRVGRHRTAMWKSMVLPAGGTALCWLLLMTLWLPILDFARSYAPLVNRVTEIVSKTNCVEVYGLSPGQVTAFKYHGGLKVLSTRSKYEENVRLDTSCPWLVVDADAEVALGVNVDLRPWMFVTKVRRPSDDNEDVLLYRRVK